MLTLFLSAERLETIRAEGKSPPPTPKACIKGTVTVFVVYKITLLYFREYEHQGSIYVMRKMKRCHLSESNILHESRKIWSV